VVSRACGRGDSSEGEEERYDRDRGTVNPERVAEVEAVIEAIGERVLRRKRPPSCSTRYYHPSPCSSYIFIIHLASAA
jgi:hypothetical protein